VHGAAALHTQLSILGYELVLQGHSSSSSRS
jgi:hypothetical protein